MWAARNISRHLLPCEATFRIEMRALGPDTRLTRLNRFAGRCRSWFFSSAVISLPLLKGFDFGVVSFDFLLAGIPTPFHSALIRSRTKGKVLTGVYVHLLVGLIGVVNDFRQTGVS